MTDDAVERWYENISLTKEQKAECQSKILNSIKLGENYYLEIRRACVGFTVSEINQCVDELLAEGLRTVNKNLLISSQMSSK